jgi:hypothetical protein
MGTWIKLELAPTPTHIHSSAHTHTHTHTHTHACAAYFPALAMRNGRNILGLRSCSGVPSKIGVGGGSISSGSKAWQVALHNKSAGDANCSAITAGTTGCIYLVGVLLPILRLLLYSYTELGMQVTGFIGLKKRL